MRDLGVLKERIEYAERHLTASHTARERESQALMTMWQQIRDRFELQEQEISRYRTQLTEMTAVNDELSSLVDRLIASVEGGAAESGNETVPAIARLADDLLRSEPPRAEAGQSTPPAAEAATETPQETARELEDILELTTLAPEVTPEPAPAESGTSFGESLNAALAEDDQDHDDDGSDNDEISIPSSDPVHEPSASHGIRSLISRIENAVASPSATELNGAAPAGSAPADFTEDAGEEDEDLARELREIESLRSELNGLRNKISAGA